MKKINVAKYLSIILLFSYHVTCVGQEISEDDIREFIPDSALSEDTDFYVGNLNRDDFDDIIVRFKIKNEPEYRAHFHILVGQKNGTFKLVAKNDIIEADNSDGTSFNEIVIKNGYFSLEYEGYGNTCGSYKIITFKYSETDNDWILHKNGSILLHRYADPDYVPYERLLTQKDFGKVLFKDYINY